MEPHFIFLLASLRLYFPSWKILCLVIPWVHRLCWCYLLICILWPSNISQANHCQVLPETLFHRKRRWISDTVENFIKQKNSHVENGWWEQIQKSKEAIISYFSKNAYRKQSRKAWMDWNNFHTLETSCFEVNHF